MKIYWLLLLAGLSGAIRACADGAESFDNETASSSQYLSGSFTGAANIVWSYELTRDATADSGAYAITGAGLMFRYASSSGTSRLYSAAIPGGIHNFSVSLRKAFTGSGNRQVELRINGVSKGASDAFDDSAVHLFAVSNIDVAGDVVLELRNAADKQVVVDDVVWSGYGSSDDPNLVAPSTIAFGEIAPGASATQLLQIVNSGTATALAVTGFRPQGGDTNRFVSATTFPLNLPPNGGAASVAVMYNPGAVTGASHSAVFHLLSNDPGNPAWAVALSGSTTPSGLTISNVQYSAANTNSPYQNQSVTLRGICSYVDSRGYAIADAGGGAWSGIYVSDADHGPSAGDDLRVSGTVIESQNMTMLTNLTAYTWLGGSNALPAPVVVSATAARQERYEAVAICISNVTVSSEKLNGTAWQVSDASGTCEVLHDPARRLYRYVPHSGNTLAALCGILWQSGTTYQVQVRDEDDFIGRPRVHYALRGLVVTPDGPRTNWYVEVLDDDIVGVSASAPSTTVYPTGGIIFPGLLDTHNHPAWNDFPTLQFNNAPYGHRDEWGNADAEYIDWKTRRTQVLTNANVQDSTKFTVEKYGEILELMAGCVAIQGMSGSLEYTHPDFGIMNLEEFPARIDADIFPWQSTAAEQAAWRRRINGGGLRALLIHLSEGTDAVARAQFDTWYNSNMLNHATTIIHGVPYRTNELDKIAAAGASIVWSPKSNMKLYHGTANIPLYRARGVNVALAPDWTASGSYNLLEEMGYAWLVNGSQFSNALSSRDIVDMVTVNAARACGLEDRYGRIAAGFNAGLVVIQDPGGDPYLALINARPRTVLLTIVDGTPRFGDAALMGSMGFTGQAVAAWGTTKLLNLETNHPFLTYDTETFALLTSHLASAHQTLQPLNEVDSEELQFLGLNLLQAGPDTVPPFVADAPLSGPTNNSAYTIGDAVSVSYRPQDFWDNDTDSDRLVHRQIALVAAAQPTQVLQVIASGRTNLPSSSTIGFTLAYHGYFTNCYLRFVTEDLAGTARTALLNKVTLRVRPAASDTDNDGLPDAWEQQIVNASATDAYQSVFDVAPDGDFDLDGMSEEQEQFTGTSPTNLLSYFKLQQMAADPAAGRIVLQWPSASNRVYSLWRYSLSGAELQSALATGLSATPPLNSYTAAPPDSVSTYFLRAE